MGCGVVALGGVARRTIHVCDDALAGVDHPALRRQRDHLVVPDAKHVFDERPALAGGALDPS